MYLLQPDPERRARPRVLLGAGLVSLAAQSAALALVVRLEPGPPPSVKPAPEVMAMAFVELPPPKPAQPAPKPAPEPAPPPKAEAPPPKPPKPKRARRKRRRPKRVKKAARPQPKPAVAKGPEPPKPPPAKPAPRRLVGLSMASTVKSSGGPRFALGHTTRGTPGAVGAKLGGDDPGPAGDPSGTADTGRTRPTRVAAKLKRKTVPDYPQAARRAGVEGTVVLSIVVDRNGRVIRATVVKGLGHGLDAAAITAAKATQWHPATVGGRPTQSTRRFDVRFTLEA